jgi:hypothetical protein
MNIEQVQKGIEESKRWLDIEKDDSTYKRNLPKTKSIACHSSFSLYLQFRI